MHQGQQKGHCVPSKGLHLGAAGTRASTVPSRKGTEVLRACAWVLSACTLCAATYAEQNVH